MNLSNLFDAELARLERRAAYRALREKRERREREVALYDQLFQIPTFEEREYGYATDTTDSVSEAVYDPKWEHIALWLAALVWIVGVYLPWCWLTSPNQGTTELDVHYFTVKPGYHSKLIGNNSTQWGTK